MLLDVAPTNPDVRRGRDAAASQRTGARRRPRPVRGGGVQPQVGHVPVLAHELLDTLDARPGQTAVDCTFGAGGHARQVAHALGPTGTLVAVDRDPAAAGWFESFAAEVPCAVRFIRASYLDALTGLQAEEAHVDLVYFDLGMSSMQLEQGGRGFSYSHDEPLDMRMDPGQQSTAYEIVNTFDQRALAAIMREYGEERHAGSIARAIVNGRARQPIQTTLDLVATINAAIPAPARFASGHPAKRVFQALRIAVNDELGQLDGALPAAWDLLAPGGVLAAISFHSLEDRRVKRFLAARAEGCICPPDLPICVCGHTPEAALRSRRAIVPSPAEVAENPRSGSARLRAAVKLAVPAPDSGAGA